MSGLDFLGQVKSDERTREIPIVSLSMTRSAPVITMCLQRGVANHIIKPVDIAALVRVTKRLKLNLATVPRSAALAAK